VSTFAELDRELIPAGLFDEENASLLTSILRGVEKEGLRTTPTGTLSSDHDRLQ
jgi:gamma-glutamylcysteine synthetase